MDGLGGHYANEISQTEKDKDCMLSKKKLTHRYREKISDYQWGQR